MTKISNFALKIKGGGREGFFFFFFIYSCLNRGAPSAMPVF